MRKIKKIVIIMFVAMLVYSVIPIMLSYGANELTSDCYKVSETEKEITRVLPETKVDTFKGNFNVSKSDVKIYKSVNDETEITQGEIGTGMILKYAGSEEAYKISVIGDLDKDSKITDIELNLVIKNVVGIDTLSIQDILEKSSDINGDGKIDHIDITLMIRYIVYGELEVEEAKDPKAPRIEVEGEEGNNGYYVGDVTVKIEKAEGETAQIEKITYKINNRSEEEVPASGEVIIAEDGEYKVTPYIYGMNGKRIEGESKEIKIEKDVGRIEIQEKVTAETIEVEVETEAISGINTYKYSIGKENSTGQIEYLEEKESTSGEIKFEGLEENTRYIVKVEVESNAGNTGSTTKEIVTTEGADSTAPEITITVGEVTTNSIEITVSSSDSESGMPNSPIYAYYIKKKGEQNYQKLEEVTESRYKFTNLIQDTEYDIRVTTKDNVGNEGEKIASAKTSSIGGDISGEGEDLSTGNGLIKVDGPVWSNRQASITLSTETDFKIQYQVNGTSGNWTEGTNVTGLHHGDKVYARLWDGINIGGLGYYIIEDKISPIVTVTKGVTSTSSIQVLVAGQDNETGLASSPSYTYYIKKNNESTYQEVHTGTETQYTFTGLEQGTEYNIKVTVKDIVENEGEGLINITTNKMGGDTSGEGEDLSLGNGLIKVEGPVWSNGQASITLSTETEFTIQYQVNGTSGSWTEGTSVTGLNHGDTVYARLWDGTNTGGLGYFIIEDNIPPTVIVEKGVISTSSIQVSVTGQDNETGLAKIPSYTYYIKESSENSYKEINTGVESQYTFTGLKQGIEYNIKVTLTDIAGNEGEGTLNATTSTIGGDVSGEGEDLSTGNGLIKVEGPTWSNGEASITLSTETGLTIQYQVNGTSGNWTEGTQVTGLHHGDKVYARLWDGTNAGGLGYFIIEDDTPPTITITNGIIATSSIQVMVEAEDNESGLIEDKTYKYYIKKNTDGTYTMNHEGTETNYTFRNLTQNTSYNIRVVATDKAGNEGEGFTAATTINIGGDISGEGEDLSTGEGLIKVDGPRWSNGQASITLSTETELSIQYQVNGTNGEWKEGTEVTGLNHGDKVYARLWDGINSGGLGYFIIEDDIPPTITITKGIIATSSIQVMVEAEDNESGLIEDNTYTYYIKKSSEEEYIKDYEGTETNYKFTGLIHNTSYDIKVVTKDKAENEAEDATTAKTVQIGGETGGSGITASNPTWNNKKASITLSTETGLTIQYQINGTAGVWVEGKTVIGLQHGDKVYARLWDGTNAGEILEVVIQDTIDPTVTITKGTVTSNSINVTVKGQDSQSGIANNATYTYFIKKSSDADYNQVHEGTETSYTFTDLIQATTYNIKVTTTDIAGNSGEKTLNVTTNTVSAAGYISSSTTWEDNKARLTLSTTTSYDIEWQKDTNKGSWTTGRYVYNLNHNDVVYVRLTDGINHGTEKTITIKDSVNPEAASINIYETSIRRGETVSISVSLKDNESGINLTNSKWVYNTSSSKIGTNESSYTGGSFTSTSQSIRVTPTQNGTYYIHVLSVDNAGNKVETVSKGFTIRDPNTSDFEVGDYVSYTGNGWSSWRVLYAEGDWYANENNKAVILENVQIIPTMPTEMISYTSSSTNGTEALNMYNNIVTDLYNTAKKYLNTTYGVSARCFGGYPDRPTYDSSLITVSGVRVRDGWHEDENDSTWDIDAIKALNNDLLEENPSLEGSFNVWTPERSKSLPYSSNDVTTFYITAYTIGRNSGTGMNFIQISNTGTVINWLQYHHNDTASAGFVPVITLKNTLKITGGDGSEGNPWKLST